MIITVPGEKENIFTGRTIQRSGCAVSALVDTALETADPVRVILPDGTFWAEILACRPQERAFVVDLMLIQYEEHSGPARRTKDEP